MHSVSRSAETASTAECVQTQCCVTVPDQLLRDRARRLDLGDVEHANTTDRLSRRFSRITDNCNTLQTLIFSLQKVLRREGMANAPQSHIGVSVAPAHESALSAES